LADEFKIDYVELPNGRLPAREFVDSLDDNSAARIDAFIERLRVYCTRMQRKFVKKLTNEIFELRGQTIRPDFSGSFLLSAGDGDCDYIRVSEENSRNTSGGNYKGRVAQKAMDQVPKPLHRVAERTGSDPETVGTMKGDRHKTIVEQRTRKSAGYRKTFARTLRQIDLALLVREMREEAGLTQTELARMAGTTQSVIARLEDAEYMGHSLGMLERIATACGVGLTLHAERRPNFDREVELV